MPTTLRFGDRYNDGANPGGDNLDDDSTSDDNDSSYHPDDDPNSDDDNLSAAHSDDESDHLSIFPNGPVSENTGVEPDAIDIHEDDKGSVATSDNRCNEVIDDDDDETENNDCLDNDDDDDAGGTSKADETDKESTAPSNDEANKDGVLDMKDNAPTLDHNDTDNINPPVTRQTTGVEMDGKTTGMRGIQEWMGNRSKQRPINSQRQSWMEKEPLPTINPDQSGQGDPIA